jgi:ribosomal protein S18 acetylase RimI-like enzyme
VSTPAGLVVRPFAEPDEDAVVALWHAAGLTRPWNDPHRDVERKLAVQREWFLVAELEGRVVGSAMAGYDGHRGSVYYAAVDPDTRGRGIGRALMAAVESALGDVGCPKVNVVVRGDNTTALGFYEALGYAVDDVVALGRRLEHDCPG